MVLDEEGAGVLYPIGGQPLPLEFPGRTRARQEFVEPRFKPRVFDAVVDDPFPYLVQERLGS